MTDRDQVIMAKGLRKSFSVKGKPVDAVRGIDLEVSEGEIFGFLGPNGAGKTTTLRMLTTLLPIDDGSARVAGADVASRPRLVRSRIGYVSQQGGADELATGRENLVLQARLYGLNRPEARRRTDAVLSVLDLAGIADRRVKTYSGGQRRRLDVALGIVHGPQVLFLDEPSTGLDPQNRAHLWEHVQGLRRLGTTVFITTHYLEEADALCDRLMIMDHGQIVAEGTSRALKQQVAGDSVLFRLKNTEGDGSRALALVGQTASVNDAAMQGDALRLYVDDGTKALPELIRLLDAEQIDVASVSLSEPTLDDVFLAKTGRSLRDAGPSEDTEAMLRAEGEAA
ncbi:MAG: ATP-binding cassette domain-containing protein [Acidimicrobiaceae bacterium]|nr:ATP-binding cassette domain-containing protein [Acidimicrobiaceae bacterium]